MNKLFFLLTLVLISSACRPDLKTIDKPSEIASNLREAEVSDNFNWSTSKELRVEFNLQVSNCNLPQGLKHKARLLDQNGVALSTLLFSGNTGVFNTKDLGSSSNFYLFIPTLGVYQQMSPGSNSVQVDCASSGKKQNSKIKNSPTPSYKSTACSSSCDVVIEQGQTENDLKIENGEVYCVFGELTGKLEIKNGGTLHLCGTANISEVKVSGDDGAHIYIGESGSMYVSGDIDLNDEKDSFENQGIVEVDDFLFAQNSSLINTGSFRFEKDILVSQGCTITNTGSFNFDKSFDVNGTFTNSGTIVVAEDMKLKDKSDNINDGTITVGKKLEVNHPLVNNGTIQVGEDCKFQSKGEIENNCSIEIQGDLDFNGECTNNSFLKAAGKIHIQSGGDIQMGQNSIIIGTELEFNGTVSVAGSGAGIKIDGYSKIKSSAKANGPLDVCTTGEIEDNYSRLGGNVSFCEMYIYADGACMTEGMEPTLEDSDGDGVANGADAEPNNSSVAYYEYYPSSGYAYNAFEDLFPSTGDYDFNDIVLAHSTLFKINSDNNYVDATSTLVLNAAGSGIHNGVGLQFLDYDPNQAGSYSTMNYMISGISGDAEALESNFGNVVKVFNSIYEAQSTYYNNTGDGPSNARPDTLVLTTSFNVGAKQPAGIMVPDFFIFRKNDRNLEIHLANRPYTGAMDLSVLQTFEDNTDANLNRYFKTKKNQPWGIEIISDSPFQHPLSKVSIDEAYPEFMEWVNANGSSNRTWFTKPKKDLTFIF